MFPLTWCPTDVQYTCTVKPAHAVTCIRKSPFSSPVIEYFIWIEPLLRGHLCCKASFSLSQRWPLNTGLTVYKKKLLHARMDGSKCGLWCLTTLLTICQLYRGQYRVRETHRPAINPWQTLSHNVVSCIHCCTSSEQDSNSQC